MAEYRQQAKLLLQKQLAELSKNPVEGFSAGLIDDNDIFKWEVSQYGLKLHYCSLGEKVEVPKEVPSCGRFWGVKKPGEVAYTLQSDENYSFFRYSSSGLRIPSTKVVSSNAISSSQQSTL